MNRLKFFKEGIKNLKTMGTITRSSRYLCGKIIDYSQIDEARYIVELGAGDGVLTKRILSRMPKDCRLLTFEINENLLVDLHKIDDERLTVIADTAENLLEYLEKNGIGSADIIYSALPFTVIPDEVAKEIVNKAKAGLKPGGEFLQIHYSLIEKKLYERIFGNVKVHFQPLNIPPAFILKSVNQ